MKTANEIVAEIEGLPYGDPEIDHIILDNSTLETLKLCLESFDQDDSYYDDLHHLVYALIQKWETIKELWYA